MKRDYKAAREDFDKWCSACDASTIHTIRTALKICERLQGEPSVEMLKAGKEFFDVQQDASGFKAMISALFAEVEGEK